MSINANIQAANIGWGYKLAHVAESEASSFIFETRNAGTNGMASSKTITKFRIATRQSDGTQLPPDVAFEVRIAESLLTWADLRGVARVKHGSQAYKIQAPSPWPPMGRNRRWRLWLVPAEQV